MEIKKEIKAYANLTVDIIDPSQNHVGGMIQSYNINEVSYRLRTAY